MIDDTLLARAKFEIIDDPDDARYEIITIRTVRNSLFGGRDTPRVSLEGAVAHRRLCRFLIARCAGLVQKHVYERTVRDLWKAHEKFAEPS